MSDQVCSVCGAVAASDARMGSVDTYLTCGCDRRGVWINDGRGGYWSSRANPISAEEYERQNILPYNYRHGGGGRD